MSYLYDHRFLADEMELYFFEEMVGAGLPMWLPNGVYIREALEKFIKDKEFKSQYQRVSSPQLARAELYQLSGHLKWYKDDMYPEMKWPEDHSSYYLRPMNCPHHHKIFSSVPRSYRELPLRLAEYGQVYRFEASGALRGLSRVRGLCQNDGHIYIDPEKAKDEILKVLQLHESCYKSLGLVGYHYRLSKHDSNNVSELEGSLENWLISENILRECLIEMNLDFYEEAGEAAFYGPKIDIQMKFYNENQSNKEESISSIQLDFLSPERFDLEFINSLQQKIRPWIIHRAPLGSHERFIALLLEYFDGQLPGWLSPVQLLLIPVNKSSYELAQKIQEMLMAEGVRIKIDNRSASLGKRIALGRKLRPFSFAVIGDKEINSEKFKIQFRDCDEIVPYSELLGNMKAKLLIPL
ncbi:MAG: threonine--tRNA ligase [Bacteriovorax sp.]|nr:threonine--tRNA ligase [Bacteriovorax sp.]